MGVCVCVRKGESDAKGGEGTEGWWDHMPWTPPSGIETWRNCQVRSLRRVRYPFVFFLPFFLVPSCTSWIHGRESCGISHLSQISRVNTVYCSTCKRNKKSKSHVDSDSWVKYQKNYQKVSSPYLKKIWFLFIRKINVEWSLCQTFLQKCIFI